jgi:cell wall-associated NlpC family hydrolase
MATPRPPYQPALALRRLRAGGVLGLLLVLAALSGCAGSGRAPTDLGAEARASDAAAAVEARLRRAAAPWMGTPHRWGGTTRRGVDCSGFTGALYRDALALDLPRATGKQVRVGRRVAAREPLQPGDLVFFKTKRGKLNHVGVYLGRGEFVHASSSQGVAISRLDEAYWRDRYWTTRRMLDDLDEAPVASRPAPERNVAPARRRGW